jgi:hydrogenase maturation protein HypF
MKMVILPFNVKVPVLACGADLKGAFALAKGNNAYLVDGFGDLSDPDNLEKYEKAVKLTCRKLKIIPKTIVCDMHPGYFSTRFAENWTLAPGPWTLSKVQHHHAHVAAAIIDNSIKGDVIGVAFDGTGYGLDGNIWGGEFFIGSLKGFKRAGHLEYVAMPGGEAAIREPWRMAASFLHSAGVDDIARSLYGNKTKPIKLLIDKAFNSPLTSSAGRLFDAAASIILRKEKAIFEAELPIAIEKIAEESCGDHYKCATTPQLVRAVARDSLKGVERSIISAKFHNSVARLILNTARKIRRSTKIKKVILAGGVFQNRFLTERATGLLEKAGFEVFIHTDISTNDSGIPIGQIALCGTLDPGSWPLHA